MSSLIHNSGLYGLYELKDQAESTSKALNLNEFVNTTLTYAAGREGLAALLEDIMLSGTEEDPFLKEGKVNLITVHNTKGLEFKRVIITGLEEGLFPYLRDFNFEDKTGIEEERRLFYVAMTRAKERLYLTGCYERRVYGMSKNSYPSRFIAEIPQEFMSRDERPANRELSPWPEHRGWDRSAPEDRERPNELYTDSSAAASDEAEESFADYRKGVGVYHGDYGTGVIVDKWFKNDLCLVKVNFFSGKKAQFILNYSSLERVSLE
jgi:DNA helicase-2/ATP-dependent DNA helicase PcrA